MTNWMVVSLWWLAFGLTHILLSSKALRPKLVARLGERGFLSVYSLVSLATFVPLVSYYWQHRHSGPLLWNLMIVPGMRELSIALSGLGLITAVLAMIQPSPTSFGGSKIEARGVLRITRHPLFMAMGLWGLSHCIVNSFASDVVFFGGFAVFAVVGCAHQDTRKRDRDNAELEGFFEQTSFLPLGAILGGRQRLVLSELSSIGMAGGLGLAWLVYYLHAQLRYWF
ncbi:MAG: NnrU family protein [Candidatus Binatia bacterium]